MHLVHHGDWVDLRHHPIHHHHHLIIYHVYHIVIEHMKDDVPCLHQEVDHLLNYISIIIRDHDRLFLPVLQVLFIIP